MDLLILAGGLSKRMGATDKAFLELGGRRIVETIIERLNPLFERVIISTANGGCFPDLAVIEIADIHKGCGSLGGLHAGLKAAAPNDVFAVACDMPFVNVELVKLVIAGSPDFDVAVPISDASKATDDQPGYLQPLHAVYRSSCLPHIEALLEKGKKRIFDFYKSVRVNYIAEKEIRKIDPEMISFFNINTPADIEKAYNILKTQEEA